MTKAKPKLTKQGVRDLDHLPEKSRGRVLPEPPVPVACKHKDCREVSLYTVVYLVCNTCGMYIQEW